MNPLQHWRRIVPVIIMCSLFISGCSLLGQPSLADTHSSHRKGGDQMSMIKLSPHSPTRPVMEQEYPLPPEKMIEHITDGNYELIYSQTSDQFRRHVSWDAFLDTLQAFTGDGSTYTLSYSKQEQGKLRQLWTSTSHNKGIVVVFAEHHPKYPDHTILDMRVGDLNASEDNVL